MRQLEAGDDEEHDHLRGADHAEQREDDPHGQEDDADDRNREQQLERDAVRVHAGEDRREQVVHDERDRVRDVEEVREGPDPGVRDGGRPAGSGLDEGAQPSRRHDAPREGEPDPERDGEDGERECGDEPGGADAVTGGAGEEAQQRERAADGGDREPEQEMSREG